MIVEGEGHKPPTVNVEYKGKPPHNSQEQVYDHEYLWSVVFMLWSFKKTQFKLTEKKPLLRCLLSEHHRARRRWDEASQVIIEDVFCETEIRSRMALARKAFWDKQTFSSSTNLSIEQRKRTIPVDIWPGRLMWGWRKLLRSGDGGETWLDEFSTSFLTE